MLEYIEGPEAQKQTGGWQKSGLDGNECLTSGTYAFGSRYTTAGTKSSSVLLPDHFAELR